MADEVARQSPSSGPGEACNKQQRDEERRKNEWWNSEMKKKKLETPNQIETRRRVITINHSLSNVATNSNAHGKSKLYPGRRWTQQMFGYETHSLVVWDARASPGSRSMLGAYPLKARAFAILSLQAVANTFFLS